ncbi:MAG: hypothetical protein J6X22_05315 [Muribaculaceae bacterium]|nr:hypothetical protein [Muribaculaceae bacterium]
MKKFLLIALLLMVAFAAQALPFVTTPSPTTFPIHWYQLKINGKYVYYDPAAGIYDQIKISPTASSEDNFLWCFVQTTSDKIVIYNRAAKQYMEMDQFVTPDINSSYICYVVDRGIDGFYISYYDAGDNRNYYLYEYVGDGVDILVSAGAALSTGIFNTNEVFVEGGDVAPGDVDGDGNVTAGDVTALYNWLLNNDDSDIVNGDQDGDGTITSADIMAVYNILLGN